MDVDVIASATAAPFAIACGLLALAGVSKIRRPAGTQPAVAALALPASPAAIRILGAVELSAAAAGFAAGGVGAIAVAAVYGALAIGAWRLLVRSPGTACGCLGASSAPVTAIHIFIDLTAMIVAVIATAAGSPLAAVGTGIWSRIAFVLLAGCGASLCALLLDGLPALNAAVREGTPR